MADLFTGPRSISPWLERAVLERLQRQHALLVTRIAHVVEVDTSSNHGLITDGNVTALVRWNSETSMLSTGIVRLSDWRIVVEKYEENNNTIPTSYTEFGVYQQLAVVVHISSLEHVGQVTSTTPPSPSILQSPDVRRHLQQHHQQSFLPLADVGALMSQANCVDTLVHIAQCSADPLPVGNVGAVLWEQQDAGTLDALVASAISPQQEEKTQQEPDVYTVLSDSEEEEDNNNATKPIAQQGIQAMLLDEDESSGDDSSEVVYVSTSPPPKANQNERQERSTTRPLQPVNRQKRKEGDVLRPLLARDDSRNTVPHSNRRRRIQIIPLSEGAECWGLSEAGDRLRKYLKTTATASPMDFVAPPLVGIQTACAGDDIRVWLAEL